MVVVGLLLCSITAWMKNQLDQKITQLIEIVDEGGKANTSFLAKITTFSVALTGLLVGLKPNSIGVFEAKVAFMVSIGALCFCSLFSLISQRYEVYVFQKKASILSDQLIEFLHDPSKSGQPESIPKPIFYKFCETATYFCLVTAMLALTIYVYLVEFPL